VEIDVGELSRALGREVTDYTTEPIEPELRLHSVTGGVFRVTADGSSLVVKIVRRAADPDPEALWTSGDDPAHRNYWKREWLAYCSGLLDTLPGELRAPRTLRCTQPSEDEAWIWMEDVQGRPGREFELDDYDSVTFDLATTQAAYVRGQSLLPTDDWLARGWLRGWVETLAPRVTAALDDDAAWPADQPGGLAELRPRVAALWTARDDLLAIVEAAPQTVVHCDFWPANIIGADDGTTVAIDWSQIGIGALGQDLDQLSLDAVWMLVLPDASLADLEDRVVRGYLSGLRTSGVDLDEASLRQWYAAAASVRYAPLAASQAAAARDAVLVADKERRHGRPYPEIAACKARVLVRAVELGEAVLEGR
jgi:hypothetical protein